MLASKNINKIVYEQSRCFSTSSKKLSIMDYFKFYKKKDSDIVPTKKTEQVIDEIENNKVDYKKKKITILGKKNPELYDKQVIFKNLNGFTVNRWIPKETYYKLKLSNKNPENTYIDVIDSIIPELYNKFYLRNSNESPISLESFESINLNDLYQRFIFIKQVQIKFGIEISDLKLTQLNNLLKLKNHLVRELNPSKIELNEKLPNAIYLNPEEFIGTNISIGDHIFEKQKSKHFKKLIKKANKLESVAIEEFQKVKNA